MAIHTGLGYCLVVNRRYARESTYSGYPTRRGATWVIGKREKARLRRCSLLSHLRVAAPGSVPQNFCTHKMMKGEHEIVHGLVGKKVASQLQVRMTVCEEGLLHPLIN